MINLGRFWLLIIPLTVLCMPAKAQMLGTNAFLKGDYVEIGVNQCGAYGSNASSPAGYHPTMAGGTLGFVADDDLDGWTGGTYPPYCGDYFLPGSPVEGWGVQIGASVWYNTDQYCSPFGIPGSITSYSTSGDTIRVVWEGNITSASVSVTQTTELILDKSYFVTYITLCNNSLTTKNNVYYKRNVDPDNDQPWSGSFVTANTIVFQPPADAAALVSSTGTTYGCYLGMGSLASNSRVSWGNFSTTTGTPMDVYNATGGFSGSGSMTSDIANSIAFYYPTIPPGECVCFAFAYILNEDQLDEALEATTSAGLWVDGEPTTPGATVVVCEPGSPVDIAISAPADYTFTWSPAGIFDEDTGFTVTAYPTTTTTITGTGIGDCGNMTVELILTVADTPTIILDDIAVCEGDAATIDLTAIAGDTPCDPLTFTNSTVTPIPDGAAPPVSIPLTVSGVTPGTFSTAMFDEVCLSINHTWDADLDISLTCPDGTTIVLSSDNGGSGDNYSNTCFVASGAPPVTGGTAPFAGTYTPEGSFAAFAGCTVNGTWTLIVDDDLAADIGSVLYWSISFLCTNDFISYDWLPVTGLSDPTVEDPVATPDSTTTYTVTLTDLVGCSYTEDVTITVSEPFTADFSYPLTVYCTDDTDPDPILDPGAASGTWSSSPAGLIINTLTGTVDLSVSVPGTYSVTNNVIGPGTCPDATATYSITVSPSFAFTYSDDICSGDTYILPDGSSAGSGGTYVTNLLTVDGCDSVITTLLTEHADATSTEDVSICSGDSYTLPDGSTATVAGTYSSTLSTYFGCDSVIITNLNVLPEVTTSISAAICEGDMYVLPDGTSTGTAGTYNYTLSSADGCDSTVIVDLLVNAVATASVAASVCDGDSYLLPDGTIVYAAGTYVSTLTDALGCDSVITTNLTVNAVFSTTLDASICEGDTYVLPDGTSTTIGGTYSFTFTSAAGCDSIMTVNLSVNPVETTAMTAGICDGDSYLLPDGSYATTAGTYVSVLTTAAGCDSVITIDLSIESLSETDLTETICEGDSYLLPDGTTATTAGLYSFVFPSAAGCDSTVTVDLSVHPLSTSTQEISICDGSSYVLPDGISVSVAGTYTSILTDGSGCDSIVTTNLEVTDTYSFTLTPEICAGEEYLLPDGSTTGTAGSYTFTFTSAAGCDSIVTVDLMVHPLGSSTQSVSICEGETFVLPDGISVSVAGTYLSDLTTVAGCDSVVTTELFVDPLMYTDLSDAICDGDTYTLPDGSTTSSSGIFSFTLVSAAGCDSIVTLDLLVNPVYSVSQDVSICDGGSYTLPDGSVVSTPGSYSSVLTTVSGCDSVILTNLTLTDIYSMTLTPSMCEGDSYLLPDGSTTTSAGIFSFTFTSAAGCDSIITIDLTVNALAFSSESVAVCEGDSYTLPDGVVADTAGTYTSVLLTAAGCDSVITTTLTIDAIAYTDISASVCDGASYVLPDGSTVTTAGVYTSTLTSAAGCDSIITTDLSVDPVYTITVDAGICDGATYTLPDGSVVAADGVYITNLTSATGCDSIITTNLSVTDVFTTDLAPAVCEGEIYTLPDGSTTSAAGTYAFTYISDLGCDSIVTVTLTVNPVFDLTIPAAICAGESYLFPDGSTWYDPPAGIYSFTLASASGCDSTVHVDLSVGAVSADTLSAVICTGDSYLLPDGSVVSTAGIYTSYLTGASGCDSLITVDLSLHTPGASYNDVSICDGGSFVLPDGTVISTAGTYVTTLPDAYGCDSTITTAISVTDVYLVSLSPAICAGEIYVLPDGSETETAGTYSYTFSSDAGCDSIVTVSLTVNEVYEEIYPLTLCDDATVILPDGSVVYDPPAGLYTYTFTTAAGCDSVVGVDLTILPVYDLVLDESICESGSYLLPDGSLTSSAGTYVFDLMSVSGCDSTVTVNLEVLAELSTDLSASVCDGDMYTLPDGSSTDVSGTYVFTFASVGGCDSIVTVDLTVNEVYENIYPYAICDDETIVLPDGTLIYDPPAGIYTYTFTTAAGCDSVVGVDLTVWPVYDEVVSAQICDGDTYLLPDGTSTGTGGSWVFGLLTGTGCDSIVTVDLDVLSVFESTITADICEGEVYTLPDGTTTSTGGYYTFTYSTVSGCDSIVQVDLSVLPLPSASVWMDATGYCLDAGWQAVGMDPAGGLLGGTGITADGFDPMLAGSGGPYDIWYVYTDALGCTDTAWTTISAWPVPEPELVLPDGVCIEADPIVLNGAPPGGTYSGTGVVGADFVASVAGPGSTWVSYSYTDANGCFAEITVPVEVWENTVDAGVDLSLIAGNSIQLLIEGSGTISWSPGTGLSCTDCYDPVAFPLQTTTYVVNEYDENGCFATDNVTIFVEDLNEYTLFVPNTFTPNGDGQNDYFFIYGYHLDEIIYLRVFDRWGEPLFDREHLEPGVEQEGWDGNFLSMPVNSGVYAWIAEIRLSNGETVVKYGNITLIR